MRLINMIVQQNYKAGDPRPEGYLAWHEWAEAQSKAGLKQVTCGRCGLWKFPQELSQKIDSSKAFSSKGKQIVLESPVCIKCEAFANV